MLFDTIAAISTPLGEGGIGIVRVSGDFAFETVDKLFKSPTNKKINHMANRSINYGYIVDPETNEVVDEVLLSVMKAPNTYTREDVCEINCHGGIIPLKRVLDLVVSNGARLAEPGEFTKRAFLNGRLDISQAEAVIDVIRAKTDAGHKIAINQLGGSISRQITPLRNLLLKTIAHIEAVIDFPEEDIEPIEVEKVKQAISDTLLPIKKLIETADEGKLISEGIKTVIAGKPNVGKSSLLNALLQENRAIVTEVPGTTRDIIEEYLNIGGIPLKIIDTAGIRNATDMIEKLGIERTKQSFNEADLILMIFDASDVLSDEDKDVIKMSEGKQAIVIVNKTDLPQRLDERKLSELIKGTDIYKISAKEMVGLDDIKQAIKDRFFKGTLLTGDEAVVTRARHKQALMKAMQFLNSAKLSIEAELPMDIVSIDLKAAWEALGEITGDTLNEDIIHSIFSDFCIGK
jgi:tRNA modification GTPase